MTSRLQKKRAEKATRRRYEITVAWTRFSKTHTAVTKYRKYGARPHTGPRNGKGPRRCRAAGRAPGRKEHIRGAVIHCLSEEG